MDRVALDDVELEYEIRGHGEPVVFVQSRAHCDRTSAGGRRHVLRSGDPGSAAVVVWRKRSTLNLLNCRMPGTCCICRIRKDWRTAASRSWRDIHSPRQLDLIDVKGPISKGALG